ncbi:MAG: ABC transporter ATP-binding protein [Thermoanaerobaculia bacterium]
MKPAPAEEFLLLEELEKSFGATSVLRRFSLAVREGEIVALLGPSGSGKTTVLRLVAGFETPDRGRIVVAGEDRTSVPPERRRVGMVFQHYALFPHMTVGENVGFGLETRKVAAPERRRRVAESLAAVDLPGFEDRKVAELSGGQQQRVALARALAPRPEVLLLDEPLSNLDPTLREKTRRELKATIRRAGITTLFVTHEQEEAFDLGGRVAVLRGGRLEQVGLPEELYEAPRTRFVATFVGRASVLPATWNALGSSTGRIRLAEGVEWPAVAPDPVPSGREVEAVIRPEALGISRETGNASIAADVVERRYAGITAYLTLRLASGREVEAMAPPGSFSSGERVFVSLAAGGPPPRVFARESA